LDFSAIFEKPERKEIIARLAQTHAEEWKRAVKSNAQIINEIVKAMMSEGYSREQSLDFADDTLKYIRRYF